MFILKMIRVCKTGGKKNATYDSKINKSKSDKTSCPEIQQMKIIHVLGIIPGKKCDPF